MRTPRPLVVLVFSAFLVFATSALAQLGPAQSQAPGATPRDPQAITTMTQAIKAVGGPAAVAAVHDFTATGTVNYYWGQGEQGNVVVKGRGAGQFRVDATLPEGPRSWAVNDGTSFLSEADGSTKESPFHNTSNMGSLSFPFAYLAAALLDPSTSVSYVGTETLNGAKVQHIQLQKKVGSGEASRAIDQLTKRDFYFDPDTYFLVATRDTLHASDPSRGIEQDYLHEVRFSDYQRVGDVSIPFSIARFINGQPVETFHFTEIHFNTGLQDSAFSR